VTRSQARTPKPAQGPATPVLDPPTDPVDPLADLRDPADLDPMAGPVGFPDDTELPDEDLGPVYEGPLVTQEAWDEARRLAVVAMHEDTTTLGFLHKGGTCGCNYIAGVILQATMPVRLEDLDLVELEPGTGA
jgi:hypothetical protein